MTSDLVTYLRALAEKHPPEAERLRAVRSAARMRQPLDGADAQALEGALCSTERERDEARAEVEKLRGDREKMLLDERDFVRKHRAEIERLTRERDEARDVVARQRARRKLRLLEMKP